MKSFLNPDSVLDQLNLKDDMVAAEFGSGSGGFSIPLAKRLDEGLVYAIDILPEPLSALKSRARLEGVKNIRIIKSNLERKGGSTIPDFSLDLVVIPNVLFQSEDKNGIISEAGRVLKNKGILAVIDWSREASSGPAEKVLKEEVRSLAKGNGFSFIEEIDAGKYHYGLVFQKQN